VIKSHAVIITTGTFLSAEMFCGTTSIAGGRRGEKASYALAETFKRLGLDLKRHRTGTPPRVSAKSIDFSKFKPVPPDEKPIPFSFMTEQIWMQVDRQVSF
jgi:tRNA uridine 5-carboxymethylaminomethyl modification enzyme